MPTLSPEEKAKLLEVYDSYPSSPNGRKPFGDVEELARHWGVTKNYIYHLLRQRRKERKTNA